MDTLEFAGYFFCGENEDGYTIFMFIDKGDEELSFTLSLRNHEGFYDHNEVLYESEIKVPLALKNRVLLILKDAKEKNSQNKEAVEVIDRCIKSISL
ncbi:hypothetical protein [Aliikangiella sp. IMCC44359]|uniref:hypothetical protein n=1 Tax=Aliikangiella sp. IMCC44359 TaxID=3459125 RepID=UPI00403B295A